MMAVTGRRVPSAPPGQVWRALLRLLTGVGASALATYLYLIIAARDLGPARYASFSAFWAVVVIVGAGAYLPIEQETGRRGVDIERSGRPRGLGRSAVGAALIVTACLALVLLAAWPGLASFFGHDVLLASAVVLGALGYAVQYPTRGLLSAQRHYGWYAAVLGSEAVLRVALPLGLVALGEPGPGLLAAVVGVAGLASAGVGMLGARSGRLVAPGGALPLLRSVSLLIVGAVGLQTLLYGGVLVARALAPAGQAAVAGQLLAAVTVTRIPVFLFQSLEALVVPRIAELAVRADLPALLAAVRRLLLAVATLALVAAVGSAVVGPELVGLMFGPAFVVGRTAMALLGAGTGVFMLAVAASDITVSLGGHRRMAVSWVVAVVVAGLSLLVLHDLTLEVTVPLLVGSVVAAALLGQAARGRVAALLAGAGR